MQQVDTGGEQKQNRKQKTKQQPSNTETTASPAAAVISSSHQNSSPTASAVQSHQSNLISGNLRMAPKMLAGRQNSFLKDGGQQNRKVSLSPGDIEDIKELFAKLQLKDSGLLLEYIQSGFSSADLATPTAQSLVQSAIEEGKGSKSVAKLCHLLMEGSIGDSFHQGLITGCWRYYECREKLRNEHFKYWLAFLNFVSDLYSAIGFTYEGELVEILFRIFDFMLASPILETLKIEELECLILSLLSVGYDLERQCPDKLSKLRDAIRDAFIQAQEPWARKVAES